MNQSLEEVLQNFALPGTVSTISSFSNGHINDTWKIEVINGHSSAFYVLQKINTNVFPAPEKNMENINRVLAHLKTKNSFKENLQIVETTKGELYFRDRGGDYWRMYNCIENALSFDQVLSAKHAYAGAKGFGHFIKELADLPGTPLHEILPDFHNTPWRFENFVKAENSADPDRLKKASKLIEYAHNFSYLKSIITDLVLNDKVPLRVTHNDTKLNNVLLDRDSLEAVAVIDLDTLMPGSVLFDFGDYIRTAARIGAEDEADLSKVSFSEEYFNSSLQGFLDGTAGFLNDTEIENLPISGAVISYEQGLRFLTDFLEGDIFYKVSGKDQNLHRAAVQFKIVQEMVSCFQ